MTSELDSVRAHLRRHFAQRGIEAEPDVASVTFVGSQPIDVLRFGPDADRVVRFVSLGCARHPMTDPDTVVVDPLRGPRAEVVVALRDPRQDSGLARSLALLAAAPTVEGVVLTADALIDLGAPLWAQQTGPVPFTAVLLGRSDVADLVLESPRDPVRFLSATPITATEAAWVRLKGAEAMREAWQTDGVDILDPNRLAPQPH